MSGKDLLAGSNLGLIAQIRDLQKRVDAVERRAAAIPGLGGLGFALLADDELAAAQASFDFDGISQAYKHLRLVGNLRGDTAATNVNGLLRFNNVSSANYYDQNVRATGATVAGSENLGQTSAIVAFCPAGTATANVFGKFVLEIPDYTESTGRPGGTGASFRIVGLTTGSLLIASHGFFLNVAGAVTRITLTPAAGNWAAGSRLSLYGLP